MSYKYTLLSSEGSQHSSTIIPHPLFLLYVYVCADLYMFLGGFCEPGCGVNVFLLCGLKLIVLGIHVYIHTYVSAHRVFISPGCSNLCCLFSTPGYFMTLQVEISTPRTQHVALCGCVLTV